MDLHQRFKILCMYYSTLHERRLVETTCQHATKNNNKMKRIRDQQEEDIRDTGCCKECRNIKRRHIQEEVNNINDALQELQVWKDRFLCNA